LRPWAVAGVDDLATVPAVVVKCPFSQQKSRSLVAFGQPLSSGYAKGDYASRLNWVDETMDGPQSGFDSVQVVWLVEPLVNTANPLFYGDGEPEIWPPQ
jgi:hypothetical protein